MSRPWATWKAKSWYRKMLGRSGENGQMLSVGEVKDRRAAKPTAEDLARAKAESGARKPPHFRYDTGWYRAK